jgi:hypothetical protein
VAKEFQWHASRCFETFTPYFHIQVAHAWQMSVSLPTDLTIGHLKNEVVERKHQEFKNLKTTHGAGRGGPSTEIRGVCDHETFLKLLKVY